MMEYFKTVDIKGNIITIYRVNIDDENEELIAEEYDKFKDEWIDYPDIMKPIYGLTPEEYIPISEKEALVFLKPTKKQDETADYIRKKLKEI